MDVIVDEMEGNTGSQIAFGVNTSTLFKIDIKEKLNRIHELAQKQSIMFILPCEKRPNESELLIECYLYTNESNMKTIVLPKAIVVGDAVTAIVQLLRVSTSKSLSTIDVYLRKACTEKKGKFKYEKVPTDGKMTIKDAGWADKVTVVIDAERQIARLR
uniref:MATH domain-containing protein n=1 Tax=Caenorhabditis tropicalis TaxID=1561998 RepID=A0A1I7TD61_9PELO